MSQRILRNTSSVLRRTFYVDGTATEADAGVTIGIVDEAGTVVVAALTGTTGEGSGVYSYILTPQTQVKRLTVTWTGTWSGVAQSVVDYVEVTGAHLFTEAEARDTHASLLTNATVYTDANIAEARDRISDEFAEICGQSFVPRYERETLAGPGGQVLEVRWPRISAVIEATISGTNVASSTTYDRRLPLLRRTSGSWTAATTASPYNVVVAYAHGWDTPPPDIKRAALILLRHQIVPDQAGGSIADRAVTMTDELGQIRLAQPGFRGAPYGIPIVDQTLARYSMLLPVS
jgi:hypothetical protein